MATLTPNSKMYHQSEVLHQAKTIFQCATLALQIKLRGKETQGVMTMVMLIKTIPNFSLGIKNQIQQQTIIILR